MAVASGDVLLPGADPPGCSYASRLVVSAKELFLIQEFADAGVALPVLVAEWDAMDGHVDPSWIKLYS